MNNIMALKKTASELQSNGTNPNNAKMIGGGRAGKIAYKGKRQYLARSTQIRGGHIVEGGLPSWLLLFLG